MLMDARLRESRDRLPLRFSDPSKNGAVGRYDANECARAGSGYPTWRAFAAQIQGFDLEVMLMMTTSNEEGRCDWSHR
jgi:hypothetical protein